MSLKINLERKELALEAIREHGTMKAGAAAAGVDVKTLNNEMRRSAVFKRRVLDAREEGHRNVADKAVDMIKLIASGTMVKTDRNILTANIALANAYEPGFRGATVVQGRIEHDIRVLTAVPRPSYKELPSPKITIVNPSKKLLKSSKKKAKNKEVIEGEVVKGED